MILVGAIAGDMIGAPWEFIPKKTTDLKLFNERSKFTDDSVLTLAIAKALLTNGHPTGSKFRLSGENIHTPVMVQGFMNGSFQKVTGPIIVTLMEQQCILGGDSDTLACISESIAEAFYGGVPVDIINQVTKHVPEELPEIMNKFSYKYE